MINFAVLDSDGKITNVIVANSLEIAQQAVGTNCVELPETDFGIGDSYDGTQFIKAPEPEVTE
jgi:hypothetical protein